MRGQPPRPNCAGPPPQGHHRRAVPPRFRGPESRPKPALCLFAPSRFSRGQAGGSPALSQSPGRATRPSATPAGGCGQRSAAHLPGFSSARFPSTWFDPTDADPTRCDPTGCDPTDQGPGKPPPTSLTPHRTSAGVHPRPGRESQSWPRRWAASDRATRNSFRVRVSCTRCEKTS